MKKIIKILPILMCVVMLLSTFSTVLAATDPSTIQGTPVNSFDNLGKTILGFVQAIGSFAAVIVLVVLGIKYMMGSAEEKAEYKKTLLPYVIGAILVFAASNLAGFVFKFAENVK